MPPILISKPTVGCGLNSKVCTYKTEKDIDVNKHFLRNVSGSKCKLCNRVLSSRLRVNKIQAHVRRHFGVRPFECNICGYGSTSKENAYAHWLSIHRPKEFKCIICDRDFATKKHLDTHTNIHTRKVIYKCNVCGKNFFTRKDLRKHLEDTHGKDNYLCQICGRAFKTNSKLIGHNEAAHTSDKCNKCPVCAKYFSIRNSLVQHMVSHSNLLFTCDMCKKTFTTKQGLFRHIKAKLNLDNESFKCPICNKKYYQAGILSEHMLKHLGIRKFPCEICGKDFAQSSHLHAHMFVHSEQKFECDLCGGKFNRKDNMKSHIKRHEVSTRLKKRVKANSQKN